MPVWRKALRKVHRKADDHQLALFAATAGDNHPDLATLLCAHGIPYLPDTVQVALAARPHHRLHEGFAARATCAHALLLLARSESMFVRKAVAENQWASTDVVAVLCDDRSLAVQHIARRHPKAPAHAAAYAALEG